MPAALALREAALQWQARSLPAVVVEVLAHQGSVPRETGTRMLVAADQVVGTIGGGHLELQAIATARSLLQADAPHTAAATEASSQQPGGAALVQRIALGPSPLVQRIALGPSLGQCCGGALQLGFTPLATCNPQAWVVPASLFTLQLYGAGHVGRAIARLLAGIECQVQWIDEREAEFSVEPGPPHIQRVCVEPVQAEVDHAPPGAFYLVLTHSHDLDLAITQAVLARGDFGYFGLIGSRTKRARFEHRLQQRGVAPESLQRMVCPIGVPGIAGKEPEVIAVAVVAQLLQAAAAAAAAP